MVEIDSDGGLVRQRPSPKLIACEQADGVVIQNALIVGKVGLRTGDKILIKFKDGSTESFNIDLIFNDDLLMILRPGRNKMGFLSRLKFLWKLRDVK